MAIVNPDGSSYELSDPSKVQPATFSSNFSLAKENVRTGMAGLNEHLSGFGAKLGSGVGNVLNLLNPSEARKASFLKGAFGDKKSAPSVTWLEGGNRGQANMAQGDWRVRVSVAPDAPILYNLEGNNLLQPIFDTNGVVFPITPQIQMTYTAKYSSSSLTHSNYAMHFYEGSEVGSIQLNGEFPVQNIEEGQYLLAAIYFFRAATKMYWGNDEYAGTPPPMVFLDGYGTHYFPHVPCVVTQFMHTMPEAHDFIEIPAPGDSSSITRLPTLSTIQVQLQPIYSRAAITKFNLDEFANGKMLNNSSRGGFV